jgi:hypothetical protein
MLDVNHISSFLHYGYLPTVPPDSSPENLYAIDWETVARGRGSPVDEEQVVEEGIRCWQGCFRDFKEGVQVIPLSGGLDSRAVLGGLLTAGVRDGLIAVTYGTPGTLDYEIGKRIAAHVGIPHESIDLTEVGLDEGLLMQLARRGSAWTPLFDAYCNHLICRRFGEEATYWSGYMGDSLSGSAFPRKESNTWLEARAFFARRNLKVRTLRLTPEGFHAEDALPPEPFFEKRYLSYDDQLNLAVRQQCYIKKVILPKGCAYRTPFLSTGWLQFILGLPRTMREKQSVYIKILCGAYPELFRLPIKKKLGLSLQAPRWKLKIRGKVHQAQRRVGRFLPGSKWKSAPDLDYIDVDRALRERKDYQGFVYENLRKLKQRKVIDWLDLDGIWNDHQTRKMDNGYALMLLSALEVSVETDPLPVKMRNSE